MVRKQPYRSMVSFTLGVQASNQHEAELMMRMGLALTFARPLCAEHNDLVITRPTRDPDNGRYRERPHWDCPTGFVWTELPDQWEGQ